MQIENRFVDTLTLQLWHLQRFKFMQHLSPTVYAYYLWCGHVVNRGQQNLGGLLYVGSNCSYFFDNNNNTPNY